MMMREMMLMNAYGSTRIAQFVGGRGGPDAVSTLARRHDESVIQENRPRALTRGERRTRRAVLPYRDRRRPDDPHAHPSIAQPVRIARAHALMPRMCAPEGRFMDTNPTPTIISPRLPAPIDVAFPPELTANAQVGRV